MANPAPRHGSLQFYPRVRAKQILPRVNWDYIFKEVSKTGLKKEVGLMGFIGYKVGMRSAYVKDDTPGSLTKGKRIVIPVTIIECPPVKILSVRFYKYGKAIGEILNKNLEKELKKVLKVSKKEATGKDESSGHKKIEDIEKEDFDDIRVVIYSEVKKTGIKKSPDIKEIGLNGSREEKLNFVKNNFNKEISVKDFFKDGVIDIHGVTKGKGLQGTIKRFGTTLKAHKSEKGRRTLGSGGPWHPPRVDYTQPRAGQMGYFTRVTYNSKIICSDNINNKNINPNEGFNHFGKIRTDYLILDGSVQGPAKRALMITMPQRAIKKHTKKNYEFIELR